MSTLHDIVLTVRSDSPSCNEFMWIAVVNSLMTSNVRRSTAQVVAAVVITNSSRHYSYSTSAHYGYFGNVLGSTQRTNVTSKQRHQKLTSDGVCCNFLKAKSKRCRSSTSAINAESFVHLTGGNCLSNPDLLQVRRGPRNANLWNLWSRLQKPDALLLVQPTVSKHCWDGVWQDNSK